MNAGTHHLDISALVGTLLGTIVTVLVVWTEFRYAIGNPSLGTKSVGTLGTILMQERRRVGHQCNPSQC